MLSGPKGCIIWRSLVWSNFVGDRNIYDYIFMDCNYILLNICIYLLFAYHSHWFTFQNHYQIYYRTISILLLGFLTFQTPQSSYVLLFLHILLVETFQIHRKNRAFQSADPSSPRCLCLLPRISRRLNIFEANTKTRTPSTKVLGNLRRVALNIPYLWFTMWYPLEQSTSGANGNQLLEPQRFHPYIGLSPCPGCQSTPGLLYF